MSRKKIALVGYRLNKGGAEKVMATLSNFFYNRGLDVHLIIVLDDIKYHYSGTVVNLGKLKSKRNSIFNKAKRFWYLKKYLKQQMFDFIIDFRFRVKPIQELLIAKWLYNTKTIYTVHSSKLDVYLPSFTPLTKLIYGNSYKVISITNTMQNLIEKKHQLKNVMTIYNPINVSQIREKANDKIILDFDYIIGVGHFNTTQKQFDKLIYAYSKSILPEKNIALVILGEGINKEALIKEVQINDVTKMVHFLGFKNNPYKYISKAKFYVMSSLHEGMPMVLLESLACGTPVISFDCPTGPNEIIAHKENGLLIENQNIYKLIKGMNALVNDDELYLRCKNNTLESVEKFYINTIGQQWLDLMNYN